MINIKDVCILNSSLTFRPLRMVALFIDVMSGISKGTLRQLTKHIKALKVYIIGQSKSSVRPQVDKLEALNSQGSFIFIETEISLIRNVDAVCDEIKAKEQKMNLIVLSTGYL